MQHKRRDFLMNILCGRLFCFQSFFYSRLSCAVRAGD